MEKPNLAPEMRVQLERQYEKVKGEIKAVRSEYGKKGGMQTHQPARPSPPHAFASPPISHLAPYSLQARLPPLLAPTVRKARPRREARV